MPDSYAIDAITALRSFVKRRPDYRETGQFLGGKSNRVLTGSWHDRPVVYKFYGDEGGMYIGSPAQRQEREARLMRWVAAAGVGPELIEQHRGKSISVIARHHGRSLDWVRDANVHQVGVTFGQQWAKLLGRPLPEAEVASWTRDCGDNVAPTAIIDRILDRVAWLLRRKPHPIIQAALDRCRSHAAALNEGPVVIVRIDNNPGNWLQVASQVQQLIDFEQSLLAPLPLMQGVLYDREADGLPGVIQGFESVAGTCDRELLPIAADCQNFLRVLWDNFGWCAEHGAHPEQVLATHWQQEFLLRHQRLQNFTPQGW